MKDPSDPIAAKVINMLGRHLVALCISYRDKGANPADKAKSFAAFSGTLINVSGQIFYLTAGHVLRDLKAALDSDQYQIAAVLADIFGAGRVTDQPIPFDLKNAHLLNIDQDGLDFGMIPLEPYYLRLLGANGVIALGKENWIGQPEEGFDEYIVLGLPEEYTTNDGIVAPAIFTVRRLESPPEGTATLYPRFVGQMNPTQIQSVKGMSGGPIFGFQFAPPKSRYWVVALQSAWLPPQRIVFGCPLQTLIELMADATEDDGGAAPD